MTIRSVVFPIAGLGTRFLPATKAVPKELLPVMDRPLIQWAVDEAVAAGASRMVFVINRNKHAVMDHFEKAYELEHQLEMRGKTELLKLARETVPEHVEVIYVIQSEARGLGHAVLCAEPVVGGEAFGIILPDDFIYNPKRAGALKQMVDQHEKHGGNWVAVEPIDRRFTDRYGIVEVGGELSRISAMVEKPKPAEAPSDLGIVGRYLLEPTIFASLRETTVGSGGEIQLTDAMARQLKHERFHAHRFEGQRFDCGSKLGLAKATVRLALDDEEVRDDLSQYLQDLLARAP
jgi:UTP--glucose-1-phosphate uridylyltransferase